MGRGEVRGPACQGDATDTVVHEVYIGRVTRLRPASFPRVPHVPGLLRPQAAPQAVLAQGPVAYGEVGLRLPRPQDATRTLRHVAAGVAAGPVLRPRLGDAGLAVDTPHRPALGAVPRPGPWVGVAAAGLLGRPRRGAVVAPGLGRPIRRGGDVVRPRPVDEVVRPGRPLADTGVACRRRPGVEAPGAITLVVQAGGLQVPAPCPRLPGLPILATVPTAP